MSNNSPIDSPGADPNVVVGGDAMSPELVPEQSGIRPQETVESFTTSHGSVYTYDEEGHTTRFKTATGQEQPKQDLTVFIEVGPRDIGTVASAYLLRGTTDSTRIEVVEMQPDGQPKVITNATEVTLPDSLRVVTFKGTRMLKSRPANLFPQPGLYAFDSRRFEKDGVTRTERHLGHRVTSIKTRDAN